MNNQFLKESDLITDRSDITNTTEEKLEYFFNTFKEVCEEKNIQCTFDF
jgi:hypothetical protein